VKAWTPVEGPASVDAGKPPSLLRGSTLLLSSQIAANLGFFISVLIIARALGPTGRGIIAFITVTGLLLGRASGFGVTDATVVFAARFPHLRPALLINLFLSMLAGTLLLGGLFALFLAGAPGLRPAGIGATELALILGAVVVAGLVGAGYSLLLGVGRLQARAVLTATGPWVYVLFLIGVALTSGLSVTAVAAAWVAAHGIWVVLLFAEAARGIGLGRPSFSLLRRSVRFGIRAWLGSFATRLNARADQVLMGFISTEAALGIYAVAVNGAEILLYIPTAAATALLPLAALHDSQRGAALTMRAFRRVFFVTGVTVLAAAVVGPPLYPVLFGSAFEPSVIPFLILLPGAIGYAASIVFSNGLIGMSSPGRSSLGPVVSVVTGLALALLLIPRMGATGAALAATIAFLAGGIVAALAFRSHHRYDVRELIPQRADIRAMLDVVSRVVRGGTRRLRTAR
jgi:O-antigen/teichoic acid export membrane protein